MYEIYCASKSDQNVTITELLFSKTSITRRDGFIGSQRESRKIQSSSGMKTGTRSNIKSMSS